MLPLANVMDFLANEFSRLRRWRLAGTLGAAGPLQCSFLRHDSSESTNRRNRNAIRTLHP